MFLKIGTGQYYTKALFIHGEHLTAITCATSSTVFFNEFLASLQRVESRIFQINIPDNRSIESSEQLVRCCYKAWHHTPNGIPPYLP
jgi:hypothetical protein